MMSLVNSVRIARLGAVASSSSRPAPSSLARYASSTAAQDISSTTKKDASYYEKDQTGVSPFVRDQRKLRQQSPGAEKLFAVRKGREVGIFEGWDKTKGKVLGFSGAFYKPFKSMKRAKEWLALEEAELGEWEKPTAKKTDKEEKPGKYFLNVSASYSNGASGSVEKIGLGWILRKQPSNELVLAGCDVFDLEGWKKSHEEKKAFKPVLSRELPILAALNQALGEITRHFKLDEKVQEVPKKQGEEDKESTSSTVQQTKRLALPLTIKSDHAYTIGLLSGANPAVAEFAAPLNAAKDRVLAMSESSEVVKVPARDNSFASALAKAALTRQSPRTVVEGKQQPVAYEELVAMFAEKSAAEASK